MPSGRVRFPHQWCRGRVLNEVHADRNIVAAAQALHPVSEGKDLLLLRRILTECCLGGLFVMPQRIDGFTDGRGAVRCAARRPSDRRWNSLGRNLAATVPFAVVSCRRVNSSFN